VSATAIARGRLRPDFPITLAIAAAAVAVTAIAQATGPAAAPTRWLVADADAITHGQVHRLVTGPFVHVTWGHLVRDLALVMIPALAYEAVFARRWRWIVGAGLALPAAAVLAAGAPAYYGLSGLSHAVLAAALAYELRHRRGAPRAYVGALVGLGVAKCTYELAAGAAAFPMDLGPNVVQAPLAHAVGGIAGLVLGFSFRDPRV
jgi:membrane associated rhomboid family serine protease